MVITAERSRPDEFDEWAQQTGDLSKSQLAYKYIKTRILDGTFSPGYRLVLGRIAGELDISVVPVREAIRKLEAEFLVSFERNVGAQVGLGSGFDYEATMETLAVTEAYATAISAPFMTPDDISRARAVNDEMEHMAASLHTFDPPEFSRLNLNFHSILFENCPNPHVIEIVHRGWTRLRSLRESSFKVVPERSSESASEHEGILRSIERGDPPMDIEMAARQHRLNTLKAYLAGMAAENRKETV